MKMVRNGDIKCVKTLLKAGADVNKANRNGFTAYDCIRLLVEAGADVNTCESDGYTPLILSAYVGNSQCVSELVRTGALVNMTAKDTHP